MVCRVTLSGDTVLIEIDGEEYFLTQPKNGEVVSISSEIPVVEGPLDETFSDIRGISSGVSEKLDEEGYRMMDLTIDGENGASVHFCLSSDDALDLYAHIREYYDEILPGFLDTYEEDEEEDAVDNVYTPIKAMHSLNELFGESPRKTE